LYAPGGFSNVRPVEQGDVMYTLRMLRRPASAAIIAT
jgi:hypothetical protein